MTNIREQEARILAKRLANFLQVSSPVHPLHPLHFVHSLDFAEFEKFLKVFTVFTFSALSHALKSRNDVSSAWPQVFVTSVLLRFNSTYFRPGKTMTCCSSSGKKKEEILGSREHL